MRPRAVLASALGLLLLLTACSGPDDPRPKTEPSTLEGVDTPATTSDPSDPPSERLTREERMLRSALAGKGDFVVIPLERYVPARDEFGTKDPDYVFDTRNPNGGRSPMLIRRAKLDGQDRAWFEVYLPIRPNGTTGWVSAEDVKLEERHERIEVDLSKRTLEHYQDGELVERFKVGIGTDQYPTGTGTFYVWVTVEYDNPNQPYGIFALGLSGFSPVLSDWPGGGRMAVHGTPYASNRGQAVSHGCVRVFNADMESLVHLPLGTPVIISD